jgi:hypothetical protein
MFAYVYIYNRSRVMDICELMCRIRGCDHSLGTKDALKFIYYFMILFVIVYSFKHFLPLVLYSHKWSTIMLSF